MLYDKEPPIWGSPYYGDTQSTLDLGKASCFPIVLLDSLIQ
jgi:hypothetical protein